MYSYFCTQGPHTCFTCCLFFCVICTLQVTRYLQERYYPAMDTRNRVYVINFHREGRSLILQFKHDIVLYYWIFKIHRIRVPLPITVNASTVLPPFYVAYIFLYKYCLHVLKRLPYNRYTSAQHSGTCYQLPYHWGIFIHRDVNFLNMCSAAPIGYTFP